MKRQSKLHFKTALHNQDMEHRSRTKGQDFWQPLKSPGNDAMSIVKRNLDPPLS